MDRKVVEALISRKVAPVGLPWVLLYEVKGPPPVPLTLGVDFAAPLLVHVSRVEWLRYIDGCSRNLQPGWYWQICIRFYLQRQAPLPEHACFALWRAWFILFTGFCCPCAPLVWSQKGSIIAAYIVFQKKINSFSASGPKSKRPVELKSKRSVEFKARCFKLGPFGHETGQIAWGYRR